jgi:hypothetical protein
VIHLALYTLAGIASLYVVGVAVMFVCSAIICPQDVAAVAAELDMGFLTTLALGAALWPLLAHKAWSDRTW